MSGGARRLMGRFAATGAAVAVLLAGTALVALTEGTSEAAPATSALSGFDPGDIISDAVMYHSSSMSAAQIQTFLDSEQPTCAAGATCLRTKRIDQPAMSANPMCKALAGAQDRSVAQVIAAVATACGVNPQVMLVMLQKEQTLVTGRKPYTNETVDLIYRKATGLGCPDTAACDPAKYGLFNQLYGVAYWLIRYTTPPGTTGAGWTKYNWFPVGTPVGVLYNPSAVCGLSAITIRNKATASLYYYTPYQPNSAALAAGWGLGNSCSAYGNRNFYLYFTTWFGSTHQAVSAAKPPPYPVTGAIGTLWTTQGSAAGVLGDPTAKAKSVTTAGGGIVQPFKGGTVYSSAAGTFSVSAKLDAVYRKGGGPGGSLGWPRLAAAQRTAGRGGIVQGFQHGSIYDEAGPSGVWAVTGTGYTRFVKEGAESGALGWPTASPKHSTVGGGAWTQAFEHGRMVARGKTVVAVDGALYTDWTRRKAESGAPGWPTDDARAVTTKKGTGSIQSFQGGQLVARGTKVVAVSGAILDNWVYHGGATGGTGLPTATAVTSTTKGGGRWQSFDGGMIYSSKVRGTHPMSGDELKLYQQRGGPAGVLGWPATRVTVKAGKARKFSSGAWIYGSSHGTWAVEGKVLTQYLAKGGPAGTLGFPVSAAATSGKTVKQKFEHGTVTVAR